MFGSSYNGANSYAKVGMETGVVAASPHKLIVMLFDGAMVAVVTAMQQMREGNIPGKGKSISKAINIIDNGLRASLDLNVGGEIAHNLSALYEYMCARLLHANLKNDEAALQEVYKLMAELKGAWEAIDGKADIANAPAGQSLPAASPVSAYDTVAPRSSTFVSA